MNRPIVWTIAGSDPSGGAGIQADLKTMNALGAHACSVVTALTAQNTKGVTLIETPSSAILKAQLKALAEDYPPVAIKLGMLGKASDISIIVDTIQRLKSSEPGKPFVICDPVFIASSGHRLMEEQAQTALVTELFPLIDLLTPNCFEVEILTGKQLRNEQNVREAAHLLLGMGMKSVLIKGGHGTFTAKPHLTQEELYSQDYWTDGVDAFWLTSPRIASCHTHGTGCTLSAAITTAIGLGFELADALVIAKSYVNQGIRLAPQIGEENGPLYHGAWPEHPDDLPWLTNSAEAGRQQPHFPDCRLTHSAFRIPSTDCISSFEVLNNVEENVGFRSANDLINNLDEAFCEPVFGNHEMKNSEKHLGFYPVVPTAEWVEKLLKLGVSTVQLRIKDLEGDELACEIERACAVASQFNARLFINDYWELALKYRAYGVHLGQSDLESANLDLLERSGVRLGLSTHCYSEVARASALRPSYIAIGPVFPTTTKVMRFAPQGLEALRRWRKLLPCPLVAIGGIFLDNASQVLETGIDGIAVVRDILLADDVPRQVAQWLKLFGQEPLPSPDPVFSLT